MRCYTDKSYKQGTILMDNENKVYKVSSCVDLNWLTKGEKSGYYLTAKYLYTKDTQENEGRINDKGSSN